MNYHNITHDDMLNGDGLRAVLWVAGCEHKCDGCQNPVTWDVNGGIPFDEYAQEELFNYIAKPYTSGVTFSGGDPLLPQNRECVEQLIVKIKHDFPDKTIWIYTGYLWEEVKDLQIMSLVDVVVDGEYIDGLRDVKIHWCGSSNQRVIDVQQSIKTNSVVLYNA